MKKLRWGLLSTAHINRRLIPALRASNRSELLAVASRSADSANGYANKWGIPTSYASYDDMLASPDIDVVYISLPNHLHKEWSIRALQAGKHVLCEKPFALSLQDVDDMIAAAQGADKVLAEAFMYRHHPQTKKVLETIRAGKIGNVLHVSGHFSFLQSRENDFRLVKEMGGGSLWDVGVYPLSFSQAIFNAPPESVFAWGKEGSQGAEMSCAALCRYSNGRTASFFSSFETPFSTAMTIFGDQGRLEIDHPFTHLEGASTFRLYSKEGKLTLLPFDQRELYLCEVEGMEDAILNGIPNPVTLLDTRNHIRTVLAIDESMRSGIPVTL